jgi:hypothetical protein
MTPTLTILLALLPLMLPNPEDPPATAAEEQRPSGWEESKAEPEAKPAPFEGADASDLSEKDQARYNRVARLLVEAINRGDRETYRSLFTDAGWESSIDWWRDMFVDQIENFGPIDRAWAPRPGVIRVGKLGAGNTWGGVGILVRFEEPVGGVLTVSLDDQDRITRTDVMIHRGLAAQVPEDSEMVYERDPNPNPKPKPEKP